LETHKIDSHQENSAAKAKRLAEQIRFRMKEAMVQRGGNEAFLQWLQSDAKKTV